MDTIKWLKRKYPKSAKKIINEFILSDIERYLKQEKYFPAIIKEEVYSFGKTNYPIGTLCLVKCSKEYDESFYEEPIQYSGWTGCFEYHALFKCIEDNVTSSGYHHLYLGQNPNFIKLN